MFVGGLYWCVIFGLLVLLLGWCFGLHRLDCLVYLVVGIGVVADFAVD